MKLIKALIIFFLLSGTAFGADHYVDCSAGTNGSGTYASPWNNIGSVNSHSFSTGEDVYFKVNTTCILTSDSDRLQIDWGGSSSNRAIIGAYYGDGLFGLNGNPRPRIDGDSNTYPNISQGLINVQSDSVDYVTVKDLKLQYSGGYGIWVQFSDSINVDNCHTYRTSANGIIYGGFGGGVNTGVISNNIVEGAGYPSFTGGGAALEVFSGNVEGYTKNITVEYNTVFSSKQEGIGFYKKVTNSIMQYNVVYDIRLAHLYIDAGKNNIIRYNLTYDDSGGLFSGTGTGIAINNEKARPYCFNGNNEIYGNLIAGQAAGINLGCSEQEDTPTCYCYENSKVYNNTLVDNWYNFRIWDPSSDDSLEVKNNISWTITSGTSHSDNYSPAGVTWSHNLFDDSVSGNAATNAVIGTPDMSKTSGWRSLTAGAVDGTEFSIGSGSAGIDAALVFSPAGNIYNYRITSSDMDTPGSVSVTPTLQSDPIDIGAWAYVTGASQPTVSISAIDGSATEENYTTDTGTYRITCSGQACAGETINLTLSGGAIPGVDYSLNPSSPIDTGTISFSGSTQDITLSVIDDLGVEAPENATITIASGTGYSIGSPSSASVQIISNDAGPVSGIKIISGTGSLKMSFGSGSLGVGDEINEF